MPRRHAARGSACGSWPRLRVPRCAVVALRGGARGGASAVLVVEGSAVHTWLARAFGRFNSDLVAKLGS